MVTMMLLIAVMMMQMMIMTMLRMVMIVMAMMVRMVVMLVVNVMLNICLASSASTSPSVFYLDAPPPLLGLLCLWLVSV